MRIKKIEWVDHTDRKALSWFNSSLPFRHEARVAKSPDEWFRWSIRRGTSLIVCGMAPTVDIAKEECQKAWEEIVNVALEPSSIFVVTDATVVQGVCTSKDELDRFLGEYDGYPSVDEFVINPDGSVVEVEYED